MNKDFDTWNTQKKALENKKMTRYFHEGEIWWVSIGINIGTESCGKGPFFRRPMLVVRKLSHESFIGIPLSTKLKTGSWFTHCEIDDVRQALLMSQIRHIHMKRMQRRLGGIVSRGVW